VKLAVTTLHDPHAVTGSLSGGQTAQVLDLIHKLREQGLAIVVISHNLDTVFDVADHIVVLRLGRVEATFERRATTREDVVAAIVGAHRRPASGAVAA
jgi:D-xylose transport system ATP-binding protein